MPMRSEASIEIERPIADVFDATTNHVAAWSTVVVEDRVIEDTADGVGSRFLVVTGERGRRMEFDGVVTRNEPPKLQSIHMTGTSFDIEATYTFEDLGGRTRVTQESTVHPKGFLKVFFALLGWLMRRSSCDAAQRELEGLKAFAEGRQGAADA